jgi:transposase InsO family protein
VSRAHLIVTAITVQGLTQAEAARTYGLSPSRVSRIMARWRHHGETGLEPRSRRPKTSPHATPASTIELIVNLRANLHTQGLDHGPATIAWHLQHHHDVTVSRATIARILNRQGLITPEPKKRPKSSYIRFQADLPNQCWQSDFTHWSLAGGADVEILTFLDDCTRYAISVTAHPRVTTPLVLASFRAAIAEHGPPQATLTDNGMVFTVRLAGWGRQGGRNAFEAELHTLGIQQRNGAPSHPQTQGKVERFQQTMKKWLRAQPAAVSLDQLRAQLDDFVNYYNQHRPHRSLPHHATPAARYAALPKATPHDAQHAAQTHDRIRRDRVDKSGTVSLRVHSKLRHIWLGRMHAGTRVLILAHDLNVTVINAATGEVLRELIIDLDRDYQPREKANGRTQK